MLTSAGGWPLSRRRLPRQPGRSSARTGRAHRNGRTGGCAIGREWYAQTTRAPRWRRTGRPSRRVGHSSAHGSCAARNQPQLAAASSKPSQKPCRTANSHYMWIGLRHSNHRASHITSMWQMLGRQNSALGVGPNDQKVRISRTGVWPDQRSNQYGNNAIKSN